MNIVMYTLIFSPTVTLFQLRLANVPECEEWRVSYSYFLNIKPKIIDEDT